MTHDDQMRTRMKALSGVEKSPLDDAARARILRSLAERGPAVVRRARFVRRATQAGTAVAGLAVAVAAAMYLFHSADAPLRAPLVAELKAPRACESWAAAAKVAFVAGEDGSERLDLGERALFVAAKGARVSLTAGTGCSTVLALESGRVFVHAGDLGGGELRVRTPDAEVVVHGTVFAVTKTERETMVEVAEGLVEVKRNGGRTTMLRAGQKLAGGETSELGEDGREDLVLALELADEAEPDSAVEERTLEDEPEKSTVKRRRSARRSRVRVKSERSAEKRERTTAGEERAATSGDETTDALGRAMEEADSRAASGEGKPRGAWKRDAYKDDPAMQERAKEEARRREAEAAKTAPREQSAEELVKLGDGLRRSRDLDGARRAYALAGTRDGRTAEAAWLALARLELAARAPDAARRALEERKRRFGDGSLAVEAAWIMVRTLADSGDGAGARRAAESIVREFPQTPQAEAARKWIAEHPAR